MAQHSSTRRAPPTEEGAAEVIFALLATWRVELCLLAPFVALGVWSYLHFGPIAAGVAVTLLALLVVAPAPNRHLLTRVLHKASVRRRLEMAFRSLPGVLAERPPYVGKIARTTVGDRVELGLRHGTSIEELERAEPIIAASLGVRDIRLVVDSARHDHVTLTITRRDPFESASLAFPLVTATEFDVWQPIPVGVDEEGQIVTLSMPEHNVLFGAEPGGGKSVALSVLVAAFALDPSVTLWLFDGKLVELAPWLDCAHRFVGPDIELAITVLEELRSEMDERYRDLLSRKVRKVSPGDGLGLHVVAIDELALYVAGVDKKLASRFAELLRDLVARGRAAGIIVLAATQKPSIDIVPSALRDLFGFRWALRCATREASDTVLGSGWSSGGFSAADIDPARRGVGLLLHEGGTPIRLRSFHLSDTDVGVISDRAAQLRRGANHSTWSGR
jgi:hypothetical protein